MIYIQIPFNKEIYTQQSKLSFDTAWAKHLKKEKNKCHYFSSEYSSWNSSYNWKKQCWSNYAYNRIVWSPFRLSNKSFI